MTLTRRMKRRAAGLDDVEGNHSNAHAHSCAPLCTVHRYRAETFNDGHPPRHPRSSLCRTSKVLPAESEPAPADRFGAGPGCAALLVLMAWRPLELLPIPPLLIKLVVVGGAQLEH